MSRKKRGGENDRRGEQKERVVGEERMSRRLN